MRGLEDNRIVKLPQPDKDLEALLGTVNHALAAVREQGVAYARHEAELKAQVESISHDLRTPLTAIVGYLALLDEEGMDADTRASLATVRRKADALQRLIAQFYELSQARNEDAPLACEPVEAGRLVRESVAGRYRLFEERGLEVRLRVPDRPVRVRGDEGALERVVENLVHNAGKYARSTFDVEVGEALGGRVTATFANDVDAAFSCEVERLFEPFYTADAARSGERSGLGLAIARSLVGQMGGTLDACLEQREGERWLCWRRSADKGLRYRREPCGPRNDRGRPGGRPHREEGGRGRGPAFVGRSLALRRSRARRWSCPWRKLRRPAGRTSRSGRG